jgi:hypothetical protein
MTPEPALWNSRCRGVLGTSKKRRKNGSFSSGFCSCTVPRVAMLTTAGETRFTIGASEGTGVSPTWAGSWAEANGAAAKSSVANRARRVVIECSCMC